MARKWTKDTVWQESMKYSSRSEFKKGEFWRIPYCIYKWLVRRNDLVGSPCTKTKQMDERCSF